MPFAVVSSDVIEEVAVLVRWRNQSEAGTHAAAAGIGERGGSDIELDANISLAADSRSWGMPWQSGLTFTFK